MDILSDLRNLIPDHLHCAIMYFSRMKDSGLFLDLPNMPRNIEDKKIMKKTHRKISI
jgi:hypothetical protein